MSKSNTGLPWANPADRSSRYTIEIPHSQATPWKKLDRYKRPSPISRARPDPPKPFPARFFQHLPREIYDCILAQIEDVHLNRDGACSSCYVQDMWSLSLVSRPWDRAATAHMYRAILLPTKHDPHYLSNPESRVLMRLKMLRRTLRNHPTLARYVRELHFAEVYPLYEQAGMEEREGIVNLVASLVMAAPNLERLVGFCVPLTRSFDRLSHALSTRRHLQDQVWLLDEGSGIGSAEDGDEEPGSYYHEAHDPAECFLLLNSNHNSLSTLILHQEQGQASPHLNFRSIVGTMRLNPHLRHVVLSGLAASAFTNLALNSLPVRLQSLRLENVGGINDKGLQRFLESPQASEMSKLTLVNLGLKSIVTLSRVFSANLSQLTSFAIAQDHAPALAPRTTLPAFHSPNLRYLHWEFRSEAGPPPVLPTAHASPPPSFPFKTSEPITCLATSLLATSIRDAAFPSLRQIRIPHDPQGLVQSLCKPLAAALTAHEVATLSTAAAAPRIASSTGFSTARRKQASARKTEASAAAGLAPLRSRVAAHCRILAARKEQAVTIRVVDPEGGVRDCGVIWGYMGDVSSRISYELRPGWRRGSGLGGRAERCEWLAQVEDVVGHGPLRERRRVSCRHAVGRAVGREAARVADMF